jgi:hypothetical protein
MDEDEAFNELEQVEIKEIESHDEIKKLISNQSSLYKQIEVAKVQIKIKAYMPRSVRLKIMKAGNDLKKCKTEEDISKIERRLYPIIAAMCIDEPFNKASTWNYIDEKTGCIQDVIFRIVSEVHKLDEDVKSFRGK